MVFHLSLIAAVYTSSVWGIRVILKETKRVGEGERKRGRSDRLIRLARETPARAQ